MTRVAVEKDTLEHLLLREIRGHSGCEDISTIAVERVDDLRFDVNWKIAHVGRGGHRTEAASRAAHAAQDKLRRKFILR
ncbi:MAG TPA: hypothetical protein VEX68_25760 [Bryobacteraceae bacterium]|jgi:hypothetical protein|nr:hypothetical protein [Bryobacteraceae bacterium]